MELACSLDHLYLALDSLRIDSLAGDNIDFRLEFNLWLRVRDIDDLKVL